MIITGLYDNYSVYALQLNREKAIYRYMYIILKPYKRMTLFFIENYFAEKYNNKVLMYFIIGSSWKNLPQNLNLVKMMMIIIKDKKKKYMTFIISLLFFKTNQLRKELKINFIKDKQ